MNPAHAPATSAVIIAICVATALAQPDQTPQQAAENFIQNAAPTGLAARTAAFRDPDTGNVTAAAVRRIGPQPHNIELLKRHLLLVARRAAALEHLAHTQQHPRLRERIESGNTINWSATFAPTTARFTRTDNALALILHVPEDAIRATLEPLARHDTRITAMQPHTQRPTKQSIQQRAATCLAALATTSAAANAQHVGDFAIPSQSQNPQHTAAPPPQDRVEVIHNERLGTSVVRGTSGDPKQDVQNAINHARTINLQATGDAVTLIATPSGIGAVATGRASYSTNHDNQNLTLLLQRQAWVQANLAAQAAIAELLSEDGLRAQGRLFLAEQQIALDNPDLNAVNIDETLREEIDTLVAAFLRGVVTYHVDDDPNAEQGVGEVAVTLVTTPKTQGNVARLDARNISAASIEAGLEAIFADLAARTMPPVGGAVITVPTTGQTAWIAYGSELVRHNDNPKLRPRLKDAARQVAKLRADAALAAVLQGSDITASATFAQDTIEQLQQFEHATNKHAQPEPAKRQREHARTLVQQKLGREITRETAAQLRGVQRRTYESDDGRWVWNVAIYFADAAAAANALGDSMRANSPLENTARRSQGFRTNPDGSFQRDANGNPIPRSLGSGGVTNPNDL